MASKLLEILDVQGRKAADQTNVKGKLLIKALYEYVLGSLCIYGYSGLQMFANFDFGCRPMGGVR